MITYLDRVLVPPVFVVVRDEPDDERVEPLVLPEERVLELLSRRTVVFFCGCFLVGILFFFFVSSSGAGPRTAASFPPGEGAQSTPAPRPAQADSAPIN